MAKMIRCNCGNNAFHIIVCRSKEPLINDEEYYCSECGEEMMLPEDIVSKEKVVSKDGDFEFKTNNSTIIWNNPDRNNHF